MRSTVKKLRHPSYYHGQANRAARAGRLADARMWRKVAAEAERQWAAGSVR